MHRSRLMLAGFAFVATATIATTAEAGPKRGKGTHTAPADDRFFVVTDPNDPRKLAPSARFLERGFGRDWVEAMAVPRIPSEVLDGIEANVGPSRGRLLKAPAGGGALTNAGALIQGNVVVIQGSNTFVVNDGGGVGFNHNDGLFAAADAVLQQLGDNFDFITIWTTFPDQQVAAYYLPIRQDVEGLGECNFNTGATFGCTFDQAGLRLQGLVFMNSVSTWQQWDRDFDGVSFALDDFNSSLYSTLGQEIAHRWGSGLRFVDPRTGNISKRLLGRDESHWATFVDTDASVMDGWDWAPADADGRFDLLDSMDRYNTLDLYTMGALPVAAAQPFFFIDGAQYTGGSQIGATGSIGAQDASFFPGVALMEEFGVDLGATGTQVDLTIQDVVDAEGNRCPDPDHTQKSFRQAIVLVTRIGETAAQAAGDVAELEVVHDTWEKWWADRTAKALTLCTDALEDCLHAQAALAGGTIDVARIEPGAEFNLNVEALATGETAVKNARILLTLQGAGADHTGLDENEIAIGDIEVGATVEVPVKLQVLKDAPCASPLIVEASIESDNAQTITEQYRLFIGQDLVVQETFKDDGGFTTEGGEDGRLERIDVALSCDMTKRTPERDATPANAGAFVTGATAELDGETSMTSSPIDLKGTRQPVLRFAYWLDGAGGKLEVLVSKDGGDSFERGVVADEPAHEWQNGFVDIGDTFGGSAPEEIVVKFKFEGSGIEGGIDDVRILASAGQCSGGLFGFGICGCSADGGAGPQASLAVLAGLLALRIVTKRRRQP